MKRLRILACLLAGVMTFGSIIFSAATDWHTLGSSEVFTYTMIEDYNSKTDVTQAMATDTNFSKYELSQSGVDGSQALKLTAVNNNYAYLSIFNINPSNHRYLVVYINSLTEGAKFGIRPHLSGNDGSGYYFSGTDAYCYKPGGSATKLTSSDNCITLKKGGYYYRFDMSNTPSGFDLTNMWALAINVNDTTITIDDIYTTDSTSTNVPGSESSDKEINHIMIEDYNSKTNVAQAVNTSDILLNSYELANNGVGTSQALKLTTTNSISYAYLNIFNIPSDYPYLVMYINSTEAIDMQLYPNMAGNSSYFFSSGDVYCYTAGGTAEKLTVSNNAIKLKQGGYYYRFDMSNAPDGMSFSNMWGLKVSLYPSSATTVIIDDIYTTDSTSTNVPGSGSSDEEINHIMIEDYNSKTDVAQAVNTGDILLNSYELANNGVGASQALKLTTTNSISYTYLNIFNIPSDYPYLVMYINSTAAIDMQLYPHMAGNSSYFFSSGDVYCYTAGGTAEKLTVSNNAIKLKQGGYYYRFDMSNAPTGMSFSSMWGLKVSLYPSSTTTVVIDDIYTTDSTSTNVPGGAGTGGHPSPWAKEEVSSAITEGLIPKDLQQNYTEAITKAQMATLLQKALTSMGAPADVYTQVSSMISGDGNLSRLDIALLIARLQELLGVESYLESFTFTDDNLISAENKPKVDFAYEYSAMVPTNNRSFSPNTDYTIEQAIVSVFRIKNLYGKVTANYTFKVSGAYGNGMILQRDTESQIVGTAPAGTTVTIQLFDSNLNNVYEKSAVTAVTGKWSVPIMGRSGSFEKYRLTVSDGQTTTTFTDVMFGEVWVAGGQSNMELPVYSSAEVEEWQNEEYGLNISIFQQTTWQPNYIYTPLNSPTGQWKQATSYDNIKDCSAVAVSFAYKLYRSLNSGSENIPVGIIYNAVGATTITTWISRYEIENTPELLEAANNRGIYVAKADWNNPSAYDTMSALYNTRVATFKGYTAAGIIYYQGESNVNATDTYELSRYGLEALVRCWSAVYGSGKQLPIIVSDIFNDQLNYYSTSRCDVNEGYRDAAETIRNNSGQAYTVAIYDLDPIWEGATWLPDPVHPRVKRAIGERMANVALANIYGKSVAWSGPTLTKTEIQGNKLVLTFDHVGDGLKLIKGNTVRGFKIAGENLVYYNANAVITGKNTIELSSESVPNPKAATYAYANVAFAANVASSDGLPMVPFRTDRTDRATTYENNDGAYYSIENQWQWCDSLIVWTTKDTNQWITGSVGQATFTLNTANKTEGDAALKVSYTTSNSQASFKPNLASGWIKPASGYDKYLTTYHNDWLLIDVIGFEGTAIKVKFLNESGSSETIDAALHEQKSTHSIYKIDLTQLSDAMRKTTYDMEILVSDSRTSGTMTIDNIRFTNVLPNITKYIVTYVADGQTVATVEVEYGKDATAPAVPAKVGYTGAWDKDGKNITADTTITANYTINKYTVTYVADGQTVATVEVEHGKDATAPAVPAKVGYTGAWDKDGKNITADTTITAVYTENPASGGDDDDDNTSSGGGNESSGHNDDSSNTNSSVSDDQDDDDNIDTGVASPFITVLFVLAAAAVITLFTLRKRRSSF